MIFINFSHMPFFQSEKSDDVKITVIKEKLSERHGCGAIMKARRSRKG